MSTDRIWKGVDQLIDVAKTPDDLRFHGLHLLAVRRWRAQGRNVPTSLIESERDASIVALATPHVLGEIRAACDGPMLVFKGPEIAARYPDPALRPYGDLDVIVEDVGAAHAALRAAGFNPVGAVPRDGFHHLRGLQSPRFPLRVELHERPSWLEGGEPPNLHELLRAASPTRTAVDGLVAPSPAHHAVLVAVHAWVHEPLGRASQLVDAMLLLAESTQDEALSIAEAWGVERLWRTTIDAAEALLFGRAERATLRPAVRRLRRVEERSVLGSHLYRALGPFWALPPSSAFRATATMVGKAARPAPGESWATKLSRAWHALRHARMGRTRHERKIGFRP